MDHRAERSGRRPPRPDRTDPRFRRLPWGDGRVTYHLLDAPNEDSARLAEGYLRATHWGVHRLGRARGAHGPNRVHLVYAWRIPDVEPAPWRGRLRWRTTRLSRRLTR